MGGKCRDEEHFNKIPAAFCLKATVYDFDVMCEEDESITEKIVDVEMIDYKTGHIWYNNGIRSINFTLFFADAPTVDAVPVNRGKWVQPLLTGTKIKNPYFFCTGCGQATKPSKKTKYCPNCGAKMENIEGEREKV